MLQAEVQVAGARARCTLTQHSLFQPTDFIGRPSSTVHVGLIMLTFSGEEALLDIWAELGLDSYRRVSGHVGFFQEEGHTHHRLTFYDAACVFYRVRFDARGQGQEASLQADVFFSAAAVDVQGLHKEAYTQLWWEKDPQARFQALNKPAELLPSPSLRAALPISPPPTPPLVAPPLAPKPPKEALDPRKKPPYAPTIAKWYKKGGTIEQLDNGAWRYTDWLLISVIYQGKFPDFTPHERQRADIPNMQGNCTTDYTAARQRAPLGRELDTSTWHHHQNLVTMQEVPDDVHARFTHYGARAIIKAKKPGAKIRKRDA
jgi:hypothetical protein